MTAETSLKQGREPGRPRRSGRRSALTVALAICLTVALAVTAFAVSRPVGRSATATTPAGAAASTGTATSRPTSSETQSPSRIPGATAPAVFAATGWPIVWSNFDVAGKPVQGPLGTIYLAVIHNHVEDPDTLVAVDPSGRQSFQRPLANAFVPAVLGPDRVLYLAARYPGSLFAFQPDGSLTPGWPVADVDAFVPGPAGTVYAILAQESGVQALGPAGQVVSRQTGIDECVMYSLHFTLADGTVFALCITDPATETGDLGEIRVVDPSGRMIGGAGSAQWSGLTTGDDGTVVAWRRFATALTGDTVLAKETQLAVIGRDGKPTAGWPLTLPGAVSEPLVGSDGTLYLTVAQDGADPAHVLAIDKLGHVVSGWPYELPSGYQPRTGGVAYSGQPSYPVRPVLGPAGSVYVVADQSAFDESIFAIDRGGRLRDGWPARLPARIVPAESPACKDWCAGTTEVPLVGSSPSGSTLVYVHSGQQILALNENGLVAAGWPKSVTPVTPYNHDDWTWWATTPDGGLAALEAVRDSPSTLLYRLWSWSQDGGVHD